jgi:hypothetical protein
MACGITGDYIDQMLMSAEKKSDRDFRLVCPLHLPESNPVETELGEDQEEVKGGTHGR